MAQIEQKLAIITCCLDDWGGSEELWARSIPHLLENGFTEITLFKTEINVNHFEFADLLKKGIFLKELAPKPKFLKKIFLKFIDSTYKIGDKLGFLEYQWNKEAHQLYKELKKSKPQVAIISQGINFDGLAFANQCLKLNIPYIIVSHKAVDFYWPGQNDRVYMKETLLKAKKCLFVSSHNLKLTEEQFGTKLMNSSVIANPVKVEVSPLPYPDVTEYFKLACIGRLFVIDKGQDILLKILSQEKWKNRKIAISFIGSGPNKEALIELANLLDIKNVSFIGYNTDLKDIWANHHALILPSRSEGLPLTIIEAMCLGRMAIVTNAGGNNEVIQEGITGFVGKANVLDFDAAMERAWNKKDDWQEMGIKASEYMKHTLQKDPEKIFADLVTEVFNEN